MERGTCKLCLKIADLQDSHYIPRRAYSMNMARKLANANPVVISRGKRVAQSLWGSYSAALYLINIHFLLMHWDDVHGSDPGRSRRVSRAETLRLLLDE